MTKEYEKTPLGQRLARYRRDAGFRNAKALADAIDDQSITRSTIVNIELGRKSDVTITELLLITKALHIPPLALVCDMEQPFDIADNPAVDGMTNIQFYGLFTGNHFLQIEKYLPKPESDFGSNAKSLLELWATLENVDLSLANFRWNIERGRKEESSEYVKRFTMMAVANLDDARKALDKLRTDFDVDVPEHIAHKISSGGRA